MVEPLVIEVAAEGRRLRAVVVREGRDLVVAVGGGDRPHVGCVVLAVPCPGRSASSSVLTIPPHKEEAIARPMAETIAARTGSVTVVSAGVHEDGATRDAIDAWLSLGRQLAERVAEAVAGRPE